MANRTDHPLYALNKDGRGVHVSEVVSGLRCGCVCGACGLKLVAAKGQKQIHHFRHYRRNGCPGGPGGPETALHRRAIEILATMASMWLPPYKLPVPNHLRHMPGNGTLGEVTERREVILHEVRTEPRLRGLCPDALVRETDGSPLMVEIVVSHDVDDEKLRRIRELGYATVAIVLPRADEALDPKELEAKLLYDIGCKRWVYHPDEGAAAARIAEAQKVADAEQARLEIARKEAAAVREAEAVKLAKAQTARAERAMRFAPRVLVEDSVKVAQEDMARDAEKAKAAVATKETQAPPPRRDDPVPRSLNESLDAMYQTFAEMGVVVPDAEMEGFRERHWKLFQKWPDAGEYRVFVNLWGKDQADNEARRMRLVRGE